ncbi:peptide chain release factor 2 [bacterium]|nr:peptide chain release factor 2 [Gemmataceae bacterium]NBS88517.1 peptide chain release factor 2 [bacterium]NBT61527.1 peptide chain release factor 2 [Planctomycetia bacterium]
MNSELKRRVENLTIRLTQLRDSLDIAGKKIQRQTLTDLMGTGDFWNNQEKAQQTINSLKPLNGLLKPYEEIEAANLDIGALAELCAEDSSLEVDLALELDKADSNLAEFELRSMLNGPQDASNAYLRIQAGGGGTEACDWAQMLLRMYSRWAERNGYKTEIVDELRNEEAGIRNATLHILGDFAYGNLQSEAGVHRLVRISPFDSNAKRHTSFAAVDVMPEIDGNIHIEIHSDDLERQTFRSGGPGGQHQNKTESGVRYIHLPTGIAAESRSERSQHKNDDLAMKLLKAKLYRIEEQKRKAEVEKLYDEKGEVAWGYQIRNYVLQPYTLAKDVRTEHHTAQVFEVLDGAITAFIQAFLRLKAEKVNKKQASRPLPKINDDDL